MPAPAANLARSAVLLGLLTVAGCTSFAPAVQPASPAGETAASAAGNARDPGPPAPGSPAGGREAPAAVAAPNAASAALLAQSRDARAAGQLDAAGAAIERALAIEPNSALLWIELAELRAAAGDEAQADTLARKALTLAGNDRAVVDRARQLMSRR
jgi:tetratricopeptide (TPR) repeat protein